MRRKIWTDWTTIEKLGTVAALGLIGFLSSAFFFGSSEPPTPTPQPTAKPRAAKAPKTTVLCDQFEIKASRNGDQLEYWIETDLPDDYEVVYWIARTFDEVDETYMQTYLEERTNVGALRYQHVTTISHEVFLANLQEKNAELRRAGLPYDLVSISDFVEIRVSIHQPKNTQVVGSCLDDEGGLTKEVEVLHPITLDEVVAIIGRP
jgi:hypothetical protein